MIPIYLRNAASATVTPDEAKQTRTIRVEAWVCGQRFARENTIGIRDSDALEVERLLEQLADDVRENAQNN